MMYLFCEVKHVVWHLVRFDRHFHFVAHLQQQKSALGAVKSDLANELIEALTIELLSNGADSSFARRELVADGV